MSAEIQSLAYLVGILVVSIWVAGWAKSQCYVSKVRCRSCNFLNRPVNSRCWNCGRPL